MIARSAPKVGPCSGRGVGGGGVGVGDSSALAAAHPPPPPASGGPPPLPPLKGGEGRRAEPPYLHRGCTLSVPIAVRPVVSGSYMSSTTRAGYLNSPGVTARTT